MEINGISSSIVKSLPLSISGHFIAGKWQTYENSSQERTSYNPSTGKPLASFRPNARALNEAIAAAGEGFLAMGELNFEQRIAHTVRLARYIEKNQETLTHIMQLEGGKPFWQATEEIKRTLSYLEAVFSQKNEIEQAFLAVGRLQQNKSTVIFGRSLGLCAAYLSFSNPLTSFVSYYVATLLAGCPLIVFSSTQAALHAYLLAEMEREIALVPSAVSIIFAGFEEFRVVAQENRIKAIFYSGSKEHCDTLFSEFKGDHDRQILLQSGGKNTALVHHSADIHLAVEEICYGAFKSAGQLPSSTSRVFVDKVLLDRFKEALKERIAKMAIGPTDDLAGGKGPEMGPLYSNKAVEKFLRFQTMASREAEETWNFGKELGQHGTGGFFVSPGVHLMKKLDNSSAYQRNAIFAPDLAIYGYDSLNTVIDEINKSQPCLSLSFFGDRAILQDRAPLIKVPNLLSNIGTVEKDFTLPLALSSLGSNFYYSGIGLARYLIYPQALM